MVGFNNKVKENDIIECVVMTPGGKTPAQLVRGKIVKKHPAKDDLVTVMNAERILSGDADSAESATRSIKPSRIMTGSLKKVIG